MILQRRVIFFLSKEDVADIVVSGGQVGIVLVEKLLLNLKGFGETFHSF